MTNVRENIELRAVVDLINRNHEDTTREISALKKLHDERHAELLEFCRSGFPGGDVQKHRNFHEEMLEREKEKREIRKEVYKKIVTGSVWGMIIFAASFAWTWVKDHFK